MLLLPWHLYNIKTHNVSLVVLPIIYLINSSVSSSINITVAIFTSLCKKKCLASEENNCFLHSESSLLFSLYFFLGQKKEVKPAR